MPKSPEEMAAAMKANLKEKTGKTLAQWLALAKKAKLEKHGQIVKHLKTEHGLTHGYASMVAHEFLGSASGTQPADDLVTAQYAGAKEPLRPILDALLAAAAKFGADVEISPKKTYVSLRRTKQFALIQPSTRTRVDLGLNLKGVDPDGRLEASGSWNSMCTHRVRLGAKKHVDAAVKRWLKQAYQGA